MGTVRRVARVGGPADHRPADHRPADHRPADHRPATAAVPPPAALPLAAAPFAETPPAAASEPLSFPLLIAFQAASAACCSASFFDRPDPDPYVRPPTRTDARKNFWWSGPLSST